MSHDVDQTGFYTLFYISDAYHGRKFGRPYQYYPYHDSLHPHQQPRFLDDKFEVIKAKKQSVFNSIVGKILDKIIGVIPVVLEKLFGASLYELFNFNGYGSYSEGYNGGYGVYSNSKGDVKNLFKSLGVLGYAPLVVLKLIDGVSTIISILKKNKFFRNFLVPVLMLLLALGAIIFLIWWMQPDDQPILQIAGNYHQPNNQLEYGDNYYKSAADGRYNPYQRQYGYHNVHSPYRPYNNYGYENYGKPVDGRGYSRSYFENARSTLHEF